MYNEPGLERMIGTALCAMLEYFGTDLMMVSHSLKVHGYVRAIAVRERLKAEKLPALECAAVLHNIGVPESLRIFGSSRDQFQERMSVKIAGELLGGLRFPQEQLEQILFLIGHHHSYAVDGGQTLQILFEADTLVHLEEGLLRSPIQLRDERFRTKTGCELLNAAFGVQPPPFARL